LCSNALNQWFASNLCTPQTSQVTVCRIIFCNLPQQPIKTCLLILAAIELGGETRKGVGEWGFGHSPKVMQSLPNHLRYPMTVAEFGGRSEGQIEPDNKHTLLQLASVAQVTKVIRREM
jgi:hypothetical protein